MLRPKGLECPVDFESLAKQHKDAVYRQMMRVCGNREDAEDVLIEALLNAYRHLDQLRDSKAFRAWLAQIGRRICWQLKERESLMPLLQLSILEEEAHEIPDAGSPPDAQLAAREMKALFAGALAGLPPEYRQVYELRDVAGLSGPAVARRLGISAAAMKSRLHRARDMVRESLDAALAPAAPMD
ncbi:MAG TPA: sigma-70 family RNA polymerase sigma factor [Verrucomicrobiae bacterium]|nr:sigma-70 family RNA polymerase sigma factor [Verrucomicrobiae bacterium]